MKKHEEDGFGRKKCTRQMPMPKIHSGLWFHPDAKDVGDGDNYDAYKCPNCGEYFKVYLDEN